MRPRFGRIDWPGACAFCLALGVSISMVVAIIGITTKDVISRDSAQLLSTIFGASVGAVATYMGLARQQQQGQVRTRRSDEQQQQAQQRRSGEEERR